MLRAVASGFGGGSLQDIAAPRCFDLERQLRDALDLPVFHDNQHGTAVVVRAALLNALRVTGKPWATPGSCCPARARPGPRSSACCKPPAPPRSPSTTVPASCARTENLAGEKRWLAGHTQPGSPGTGLGQALDGADVFIGVSAAGVLGEQDVARMADSAIVFALANPEPEIDPDIARRHVAVVATGRSDQPNQINNVLAFLGIFRGLLDGGAADLTVAAQCAATRAIAGAVPDDKLDTGHIVPDLFDDDLVPAVARAVMDA